MTVEFEKSGQGSFTVSGVTGGSKANFNVSATTTNQQSQPSESMMVLSPVFPNLDRVRSILFQISANASASIGGNSMSANGSVSFQVNDFVVTVASATAEEHHSTNIPSAQSSGSVMYSLVNQGQRIWRLFNGLPADNFVIKDFVGGLPSIYVHASASANQTGSSATAYGSADIRTVEDEIVTPPPDVPVLPPPPPDTYPPPLPPPAQAAGAGVGLLLAGAALLMSQKKRGRR